MDPSVASRSGGIWPDAGLTRVPFAIYSDRAIYERERARLFMGATWNYLALEGEVPNPGDYKTTFVGDVPVVVVRDADGAINAFENRCAHRGALVCLERFGSAKAFTCVYHAWSYDLKGRLRGVAFQNGVNGAGGMPPEFRREEHGLRPLKVDRFAGLVFGSFDHGLRPVADYLGPEIAARVKRVLPRPVKVLGYFTQVLNNNWKLYVENVKDSYHASILHLFFTTFRINRLSQSGGIVVDESGGHHVSYSKVEQRGGDDDYEAAKLRSDTSGFGLLDPTLLSGRDEFGDAITLQILTIFPTLVLQQIQNCLAVRQVLPKGPDKMEIVWTYYGFADDNEALAGMRLKQCNMVGPAGYISMEDGAVGAFVQRALPGAGAERSIVMMGGHGAESQPTRATETSVRGFWKAYRALMDV
jgi:anthranilate 1,2-dioxygenase large subunit/terephthalate 1,2-dioxygenase oxygenase component alpha subunit